MSINIARKMLSSNGDEMRPCLSFWQRWKDSDSLPLSSHVIVDHTDDFDRPRRDSGARKFFHKSVRSSKLRTCCMSINHVFIGWCPHVSSYAIGILRTLCRWSIIGDGIRNMSRENSVLVAERVKSFRNVLQENFTSVRHRRDPRRVATGRPILLVQHFDRGALPSLRSSSSNDDAVEVAHEFQGLRDRSKPEHCSRWTIRSHRFAVSHSSQCPFCLLQDRQVNKEHSSRSRRDALDDGWINSCR